MNEIGYLLLPQRGVLQLSGPNAVTFLQGLISQDMAQVSQTQCQWAALLTAQGKYLYDFFIYTDGTDFYLEGEKTQLADLASSLNRYKLRSKITLQPAPDLHVIAGFGAPPNSVLISPDPRHKNMGWRGLWPNSKALPDLPLLDFSVWDSARIALSLPDGRRDLIFEKSTLHEGNFDLYNGISFKKGCYIGQELVSRTQHRGLVKRRLRCVKITSGTPSFGVPIFSAGQEVGEMRSLCDTIGLALLRLELTAGNILNCGDALLEIAP